ncbi:hypothetical protein RCMENCHIE_31 [Rhodobacter phage RcMenchie]|nr:hypothetical protein RCMENCHIE_31 [Rhodobacter phage RcMenchie]
MAFVKRSSASDRLAATLGDGWRRALDYPLVRKLIHGGVCAPLPYPTDEQFASWLTMFDNNRWIATVPMDIKVFVYVLCLVLNRAGKPLPVTRNLFEQLNRHLCAESTLEKIDAMDGASFATRQLVLWDLGPGLRNFQENHPHINLDPPFKVKPKPAKTKFAVKPRPKHPVK